MPYSILKEDTILTGDDRNASDTLEESEASYHYLFESNPQPMWIYDPETLRFLLVNRAASEHYGYSQGEFLNMTLMDIRPEEDKALLAEAMVKARMAPFPHRGKRGIWRHRKKNGQIIEVEVTANELRFQGKTARMGMLNDITEQKRIERALQQSEQEQRLLAEHLERERERLAEAQTLAKVESWEAEQKLTHSLDLLRAVTEGTSDAIFAKDAQGRYLMINTRGAHMVGKTPAEIIGRDNTYIFSPETAELYRENDRLIMETGETQTSESVAVAAGITRTYHSTYGPLRDHSGDIIGVVGISRDITERKQTQNALHHLMEGAHCLVWQAEVEENGEELLQWKMQFANEQSAQRFLPLHVTPGRTYGDVWHLSRPEEDKERTDLYGSRETRAGRSYQQEFRCHSADGTLRWLAENVRVETLGEGKWRNTGVCIDITERKLAEEAARAMTRGAQCLLWYAFVEEQPHGFQWYTEMPDEEAAQQFFPIVQRPEQSYASAFAHNRLPEVNAVMNATATEALRDGRQGYRQQFRCRRADGEWRWLNETVRIEALAPGRWHCVGVCTDITEQKQAEEERDRFFMAKQEADAANHAKSEFLSRMSHELRTPLNAILGFGQILDKEALTSLQRESIQYILKGGRHLLGLINEILDIARVEAGHIDLSLEPIALAEIVSESCALVRPLATERNIAIEIDVAAFQRRHVQADRQRIKQALINLLSNAIKYNREGGEVRVYAVSRSDERLGIAVQDTGPGLTLEDQAKLFTPFERLHATNSEVEGTGLGLVLARRLVTAMGGSLTLESLPGEGTTFFLELPVVPSPAETLTERLSGGYATAPGALTEQCATVLYIEDNLSNMRLLEVILRSRPGITLLPAMQGSVGLDLARQHEPDLILLDLNLPDISGKEVLDRLQASAITRDIPVIVLSADATAAQIERLKSAGAKAYLTKPLDVAEFLQTLDTLLPNKQADDSQGNFPKGTHTL